MPFPEPTVVSEKLQFIPIAGLISLKLDSWRVTPHGRLRDKADVVELIRRLGREVGLVAGDVMEVAPVLGPSPESERQTVGLAVRYLDETLRAMLATR